MKSIRKPIHLYRIAAPIRSILFYIKSLLYYSLAISIGCFILCFNTSLNGQSSFQVNQHFTTANGLSSNNVTKVFRDSRGLLWIGTEHGLNCYDGQKFTTYNSSTNTPIQISNNFINDIAEDSLGRVWVATNNGLNIMDLVKASNTILADIDAAPFREKKFIKFASIVKGAAGSMWVSTENNLCEVDTNLNIRVITSPFLDRPRHLTKDKNGMIWGALYLNFGFFKFNPKKEQVHIYTNYFDKAIMQDIGLSGILSEEYIIANDVENNIVGFTESSKLLFNLDTEAASIHPIKKSDNAPFIGIRLLHLLDPYVNKKSTESFNPWCKGILFEAGSQVWVATIRGLFLLKDDNSIRIKKEAPLDGLSLRAIYQTNEEEIYIGSYMGLYKWNLTTNKLQVIDSDIFICSFSPYKGDTLLMTSDPNRLYLLNTKTDEVFRYQFTNEKEYPSYKIFSILKDDKNSLWLGNFKVDIRPNQPDSLSFIRDCSGKAIFKNETVYVIKKGKKGDIWFGTNTGLYKKDSCVITYYNLLDKEASAFSQVAVNDLYEKNDSTVIIGSKNKGLYIFNPKKQTFKLINQSNGLSDNRICSIVLGNDNDYWISTFHGLNHLSSEHKILSIYYEKDGLANNEFNTYSSCKLSNGDIFFGGIAGGTTLQKGKDTVSNKVHEFDKLFGYKKVNSVSNKFEEFYFDLPNPSVTLHADEHYIEFFLKNIYAKDKVGYSYFLKGFDTKWINNNNNSEAIRYTNLDAGQYTFFIRSVDKSGARKVISAELLVKQYFYESAWFKATIALGLFSLLYLINYYRLHQKRVAKQFKEKLVNDLHDDIGGSLNNIQRIITLLQSKKIPIAAIKKELQQVSYLSNEAIINMSDVIWAVNPNYSATKDLITRIRDMADGIFPILQIPFDLQIQNISLDSPIDFETRYQLLMICKEGFTNITKHTDSDQVLLELKAHRGQFVLRLQNEFTKKKTNAKSNLIGLKSIEKRAKTLDGTIEIINQKNLFSLILKIKNFTKAL